MKELYTDADWQHIQAQLRRRLYTILAVAALFLAAAVFTFIRRTEIPTVILVILAGAVLIFGLEMFWLPVHRYEVLVRSARKGRTHTETLIFDHIEPEVSLVDGVSCTSLVFLGSPDKHGTREQLYYWDREIPLPAFTPGRSYEISYTGKNIVAWGE